VQTSTTIYTLTREVVMRQCEEPARPSPRTIPRTTVYDGVGPPRPSNRRRSAASLVKPV